MDVERLAALFRINRLFLAHQIASGHLSFDLCQRRKRDRNALIFIPVVDRYQKIAAAPIEKLSIMRLDGDMYESTMDGLKNLYPKLSPGGFIIIDDWGVIKGCKQAVLDYRQDHGITEAIKEIDWSGIYWRKEKER